MGPENTARYNPCDGTGRVKVTENKDYGGRDQREFLEKVTESGGCHREAMRRILDEITPFVI